MLISGGIAYVLALFLALRIDEGMRRAIERLVRRGGLYVPEGKTVGGEGRLENVLWQRLEVKAARASFWGGFIVSAVMLFAFLPYMLIKGIDALVALEVWLGYVAGRFLGRMVAYGKLGKCLGETGVQVRAQPGHPDGAAGLQPIGEFYFFQAMVVAIPGVFVGAWLAVMSVWDTVYRGWEVPYLFLMGIAILLFNWTFLGPLRFFHWAMRDQKRAYSGEADELSRRIVSNKARLAIAISDPERSGLEIEKQLAAETQRYNEIEKMPTWPIGVHTRRRYSLSNILLSLPIASFFTAQQDPLKAIGVWTESVVRWLVR